MTKALPRSRTSARSPSRPSARRKRTIKTSTPRKAPSRQALQARRKFLKHFPGGFRDETYLDWERSYKWDAHKKWDAALNQATFEGLIKAGKFEVIAAIATRIESRTNLLFSFEKMALRDAVRSPAGARVFALALFDLLHGADDLDARFSRW